MNPYIRIIQEISKFTRNIEKKKNNNKETFFY
jgi:hypothetical protein